MWQLAEARDGQKMGGKNLNRMKIGKKGKGMREKRKNGINNQFDPHKKGFKNG